MNKYKLKELLTIQNGKDYKHLKPGKVPVYGTGGIMTYVSDYLFDGESILLPRKGTLDNIMFVNGKFWTVDTMYWTKINSKIVYPKYLYYYLSLLDLSARDSGSTLPSMTFDSYYTLDIDLPSLETQKKLADKVSFVESKINVNNQINSELESMAKTIYDYWFLQFEFPNEEGKPYKSSGGKMVWNDELKREIPEGWKTKSLSEIVIENEKSKTQVGDVSGVGNYPFFTSGESILKSNKHIVDGMNCYLSTGGNATLKFFDGKADYSTDTWCISANNDYKYMLYMYLKSILPMMDIKFFHGTGLKHLQKPLLLKEIVIVPSESILNKFNNIVEASFKTISKKYNENQELASLRDFLLPMLMNGQITFKEN